MSMPHKTSLNEAGREVDFRNAQNLWSRGQDWFVFKIGKRWRIADCFGRDIPHFKTKKAAYEFGTNLVLAACSYDAAKRNGLETYN